MSAKFSKMRLVPEGEYERLRAKGIREYDPSVKQVLRDIETAESIVRPSTTVPIASVKRRKANSQQKPGQRLRLSALHRSRRLARRRPQRASQSHAHAQTSLGDQVLRYQHAMERVRKGLKQAELTTAAAAAASPAPSFSHSTSVTTQSPGVISRHAAAEAESEPSKLDAISLHALDFAANSLAKQFRKRATQLVQWIGAHATPQDISINENHELTVVGEYLQHSSIIDIFKKIFVKSNQPIPVGYREFLEQLIRIHTPHSFLGYARIPAQVGQGRARPSSNSMFTPPGHFPIILRVYPNI